MYREEDFPVLPHTKIASLEASKATLESELSLSQQKVCFFLTSVTMRNQCLRYRRENLLVQFFLDN